MPNKLMYRIKGFRLTVNNVPILTTIAIFLVMYSAASLAFPGFFSLYNYVNIFKANAYIGIIAVGMTFVIISGGIDLSVGSVVAFTTILIAKLNEAYGVPCWISMLICLVIGASLGFLVGCLISFFELPAFLVTLVAMFLMRGLAYMIHQGTISIMEDPFIIFMKKTGIKIGAGNFSLYVLVFFIVLLAGIYISKYTKFGRTVYAIGGNQNSAVLMGLPVKKTQVMIYTLSGFLSALGGIVFTIHLASGKPHNALGLELDVIAAVVIGGTLLTGGSGRVIGSFFGVLIYGLIFKLPAYISSFREWWAQILVGLMVLGFILIQTYITSNSSKLARGEAKAIE
ncbi:MAG: sugar ABC transporter permease YjfF [Spirochaetales bacterium]|nr:sugar ABC transporter permease YjfF [Spirochaetales bacterium]